MTPRESLELHVPEPDPPRRSGCSVFGWLALLLAIALGIVVSAPRTAPDLPAHSGAPLRSWSPLGNSSPRSLDSDGAAVAAWEEPRFAGELGGAPTPTGSVGTALLGGYATFYSDPSQRIDHYAAAGPLLRDALGHWRGKVIRVTSGSRSTIVRLADFCACGERHGLPTLLDLSPEAFRDLAPLSAGIVRVEIELVELPATDALPRNAADLRMMREALDDGAYR